MFKEDNNFLGDLKMIEKELDNMKLTNGDRQYIAAGAGLEAKKIIQENASKHKNIKLDKLQLGKYSDSAVIGHLSDDQNVNLKNLHGKDGWNYQVGYINRTTRTIARFLNDGTVKRKGTHFFDVSLDEIQSSREIEEAEHRRAKIVLEKKKGRVFK